MIIFKKVLIVFLLTIVIYGYLFTFLPVGPRTLLGMAGLLWLLIDKKKYINIFSPIFFSLFRFAFVLFVWGLITMAINGSTEALFSQYLLFLLPWIGASYFIFRFSKGIIIDFKTLSLYMSLAIVIESIFALSMKFNPSVSSFANNVFVMETGFHQVDFTDMTELQRVVGVGIAKYFGVLPSCIIGLISCVYLLLNGNNIKDYIINIFFMLIIFIASYLTARTSGLMLIISLILLTFLLLKKAKLIKYIIWFCFLVCAIGFVFTIVNLEDILPDVTFAYVTDFNSNGSVDTLLGWYQEIDFNLGTLLIGDARYSDGDGYYGGMDIGYVRIIYYGGIIGLGLIIYYYYLLISIIKKNMADSTINYCFTALFVSYLVMMTKGHVEFVYILLLYVVFSEGFKSINKRCNMPNILENFS